MVGVGVSVTFQAEKTNWEGGMMVKSGVAWQDTGECDARKISWTQNTHIP